MRRVGPAFCFLTSVALGQAPSAAAFAAGQSAPTTPVPSAAAIDPDSVATLTKEQLADGVYLFRASTALDVWTATNVVVVVNQDDVTVFDSFTQPATARRAIAEIRLPDRRHADGRPTLT